MALRNRRLKSRKPLLCDAIAGPSRQIGLSHMGKPMWQTFVVNSAAHGLVIGALLINTGQVEGALRVTIVFRSSYS